MMPSFIHQTLSSHRPWVPVDANGGPLSLRIAWGKPHSRTISLYRYEAGAKYEGRARAGDLYVLEGRCRIRWDEDECVLNELDFVTCPAGAFRFEVLGDRSCVVVQVWLLPPEVAVGPCREFRHC